MESAQVVPGRSARVRVGLGAAVVLVLVAFAIAVLVSILGSTQEAESVPLREAGDTSAEAGLDPAADSSAAPSPTVARIFVHILGAVERPGLYELRSGGRAIDAIAAAGGFTATADQAGLNLARLLVDGEQIVVPAVGEVLQNSATGGGAGGAATPGGASGGLVNLNTADSAGLDTLPGVGPATAQRILDWREANGGFTSVEDLQSVSGIGEKTFAELKDLVTV